MPSINSPTPDATTTSKGKVQLAGVLAGTAASPTLSTSAILLGYVEITADVTSTAVTTITDVTGMSVTVTVPSGGRRVKVTVYQNASSGNGGYRVYLREGTTELQRMDIQGTTQQGGAMIWSSVATAGSHTYKVSQWQGSAGTMALRATTTYPASILVELI